MPAFPLQKRSEALGNTFLCILAIRCQELVVKCGKHPRSWFTLPHRVSTPHLYLSEKKH